MIAAPTSPTGRSAAAWLRSATRATRWGLAVTLRSLRFVPPLLGLFVFLGLFLVQGGQATGSVVATDVIASFVLAIWVTVAHLGAMPRGHGEITQATVGRAARFFAEVVGASILGLAAALVSIGWALVLPVTARRPDAAAIAAWLALVLVGVIAGVATGCLVHRLPLGAPARFVVAVGAVALVLARPALTPAASWVLPPVMDMASAVATTFPPASDAWGAALGALAWSVVALAIARTLGDAHD
jgi:hypothetical protein